MDRLFESLSFSSTINFLRFLSRQRILFVRSLTASSLMKFYTIIVQLRSSAERLGIFIEYFLLRSLSEEAKQNSGLFFEDIKESTRRLRRTFMIHAHPRKIPHNRTLKPVSSSYVPATRKKEKWKHINYIIKTFLRRSFQMVEVNIGSSLYFFRACTKERKSDNVVSVKRSSWLCCQTSVAWTRFIRDRSFCFAFCLNDNISMLGRRATSSLHS